MLKPATPNEILNRVQPPPLPVEIDGKVEYEIAEILDSKVEWRQKPCSLLYLVRWAGYEGTDEETSWVLMTELGHASENVTEFHSAYPAKPGPWPSWFQSFSFCFSLMVIFHSYSWSFYIQIPILDIIPSIPKPYPSQFSAISPFHLFSSKSSSFPGQGIPKLSTSHFILFTFFLSLFTVLSVRFASFQFYTKIL